MVLIALAMLAMQYFAYTGFVYLVGIAIFLALLFPLSSWREHKFQVPLELITTLKITSFNIQWNIETHDQSLRYIKDDDADIVVLQEVTAETRNIIKKFNHEYPYQYGEGHSHVMVLSRHKIKFIEYLNWPGKFSERALHLVCEIHEQTIHIIAIHMQVTRTWRQIELRDSQINCLLETLNGIAAPVVVVGDFNAGVGSRALVKIQKHSELKGKGSLVNYRSSWPSKCKMLGVQLDHVMVTGELIVTDSKLGPALESDHRPISVTIGLTR